MARDESERDLDITQFIGIALDPTNPDIAYGGSQDNGTAIFHDVPGWSFSAAGDGGFVRVDPSNPNKVYHESNGISLQRSDDGGAPDTWFDVTSGINAGDPHLFYVPYVYPAHPNRLLFGTNSVYETTTRGDPNPGNPQSNGWKEIKEYSREERHSREERLGPRRQTGDRQPRPWLDKTALPSTPRPPVTSS